MDSDHKPTEKLAETAVRLEDSPGYAREHDRRKLVGLQETIGTEVELEDALLALSPGEHPHPARESSQGKAMHEEQRVAEMATAVLARQAEARAERTGEPLEEALEAVRKTEAGRQLGELRDGAHRDEGAKQWQEDLPQKRAKERKRARREEHDRAQQDAAWALFVKTELRERELRQDGQLAKLLGEPQPGESPVALRRLASEDQRQAEEGLVALMSSGKIFYKHVDELSQADCPARIAANRARMTWLKERRDGWLARQDDH
ncbi:MAG: hypothetical protein LC781_00320 [Actinobacteria bacterium]|nr:hypothetical protein [Actinomycetota bacterium]